MEFFNTISPQTWAIIALCVIIPLLLLLLREFWCWYFKINQRLATMQRIEQLLIAQAKREKSVARDDASQEQKADDSELSSPQRKRRSPYSQSLSGEELEEGLKGLVLRADDRRY